MKTWFYLEISTAETMTFFGSIKSKNSENKTGKIELI